MAGQNQALEAALDAPGSSTGRPGCVSAAHGKNLTTPQREETKKNKNLGLLGRFDSGSTTRCFLRLVLLPPPHRCLHPVAVATATGGRCCCGSGVILGDLGCSITSPRQQG